MQRTTRARATLAVLAALAVAISVGAAPDAGGPASRANVARPTGTSSPLVAPAEALVGPGQPPAPCTPGRWKCPLGSGLL